MELERIKSSEGVSAGLGVLQGLQQRAFLVPSPDAMAAFLQYLHRFMTIFGATL